MKWRNKPGPKSFPASIRQLETSDHSNNAQNFKAFTLWCPMHSGIIMSWHDLHEYTAWNLCKQYYNTATKYNIVWLKSLYVHVNGKQRLEKQRQQTTFLCLVLFWLTLLDGCQEFELTLKYLFTFGWKEYERYKKKHKKEETLINPSCWSPFSSMLDSPLKMGKLGFCQGKLLFLYKLFNKLPTAQMFPTSLRPRTGSAGQAKKGLRDAREMCTEYQFNLLAVNSHANRDLC